MVGHFLQQTRRTQSSLSQSQSGNNTNTNPDFSNGTTANISSASTSASSSFSSTNSDANFRTSYQQYQDATIYANTAMSSSNAYGYNGNGGGSNGATNISHAHNHHHYPQQMGMKPTNAHEGYPPAHYTPPQNLTAEAVAALPPPGTSCLERAMHSLNSCSIFSLVYSIFFYLYSRSLESNRNRIQSQK